MVGVVIFAVASLLGGLAQNEAMLLGCPGPAGPRRRDRLPRRPGADHHDLPGRPAAQPRVLGVRRDVRRRCRRRPDPRRLAHRPRADLFGTVVDGWRLTFLINVPIGLARRPRRSAAARASASRARASSTCPARVTGTLGLVGIVYGLTRAGDQRYGWGDTWTLGLAGGRRAAAVAFIVIERRVAHPLLPFRILANRTRATSFMAMMLVPAAMFAMFYFL